VDEMMVILPFEKDFYAKNGMEVHYVGHPLLDAVQRDLRERPDVQHFRENNQLDDREIIALLPGSRKQEINAILPQMMQMVERFPQYRFVVSTVSWLPKDLYDKYLQHFDVVRVCDQTYALLANAKAAIVASGISSPAVESVLHFPSPVSGWVLPSAGELRALSANRCAVETAMRIIEGDAFSNSQYVSSSQDGSSSESEQMYYLSVSLANGFVTSTVKTSPGAVRPVMRIR
jgi:hypothetical protein